MNCCRGRQVGRGAGGRRKLVRSWDSVGGIVVANWRAKGGESMEAIVAIRLGGCIVATSSVLRGV